MAHFRRGLRAACGAWRGGAALARLPPTATRNRMLRLLAALVLLTAPGIAPAGAQTRARDTLTIGVSQFPPNLNPHTGAATVARSYVLGFTLRAMSGNGTDWGVECRLCETLPSLQNGLAVLVPQPDGRVGMRVTFTLKAGLAWADGTPVTSDDVLFTWQASRDPASAFLQGDYWRRITAVEVVDPRTFVLVLDRATFDYKLQTYLVPINARIEKPRWEADPATWRNRTAYEAEPTLPGLWNGPFRIAAVQPGASITLERNPHWPGPGSHFRRIVIRAVENTTALEAQLLAGQLDMVGTLGLPPDQAAALQRRVGDRFRFQPVPSLNFERLDLNHDHPALADKRVRQALLLAIDRETIVARIYDGKHEVAHTRLHPREVMYADDLPRWPFDPARAAALLEEAGYRLGADGVRANAAGERLTFDLLTTAGNRPREATQVVLQSMLKQIGVELRPRVEPARVLFGQTLQQRRFQGLAMIAWSAPPEQVPEAQLHSAQIPRQENSFVGANYGGYRSAEMDAILEALPSELDDEKRRALWRQFETRFVDDLPSLPLFWQSVTYITPPWLEGVEPPGNGNATSNWAEHWRAR